MKLQSQVSRKYKNKEYVKFWIVIPNKLISSKKWKPGIKLNCVVLDNSLIISPIK